MYRTKERQESVGVKIMIIYLMFTSNLYADPNKRQTKKNTTIFKIHHSKDIFSNSLLFYF